MKKIMFVSAFASMLLMASPAMASCTVCILGVNPNPISANTPTVVTVTASVSDPAFIPGSMNLLKTNASGQTVANLGAFNDNGVNGDEVAGDGVLTIQVTVNESSNVYLRASAAIRGKLLRSLSSVETLVVQ